MAIDVGGIPPEYLSPKVSVDISRVAYDFDQWEASGATRPFAPSVPVTIRDNRAFVQAVTSGSGDKLVEQFRSLGAEIISATESDVSAWVPLGILDGLVRFEGLAFADSTTSVAELGVAPQTNDAPSDVTRPSLDFSRTEVPSSYKSVRLSDDLARVAYEYDQSVIAGVQDEFHTSAPVRTKDGRILVQAVTTGTGSDLADEFRKLGAEISTVVDVGVVAWVPANKVGALRSITQIAFAESPLSVPIVHNVGSVGTFGDGSILANDLRSRFLLDGTGQKVGIISDSFDYNDPPGAKYQADQQSNDLPGPYNTIGNTTPVQNLGDPGFGFIPTPADEGRAMAQIVHDLAPKAQLAFKTGYGLTKLALRDAIQTLKDNGATVIVSDLMYLDEPMFMDGKAAQKVDELANLTVGPVPYIAAAGNNGSFSYEAASFVNSGVTRTYQRYDPVTGLLGNVTKPLHNFASSGTDAFQNIFIPANQAITIAFQWEDPFKTDAPGSIGATHDMDLLVYDSTGTVLQNPQLLGAPTGYLQGTRAQPQQTQDPWEYVQIPSSGIDRTFTIAIAGFSTSGGNGGGRLKYVVFGAGQNFSVTEYATNSPTSYGSANAGSALAIGAYNSVVVSPTQPEWYSAKGGICTYFDVSGNPITCTQPREKPDVVGPDNVNTTFFSVDDNQKSPNYFPGPYDSDILRNFTGTSAAAPHVAAAVALLKQLSPSAIPTTLFNALRSTAFDMNTSGYDNTTGKGRVNALDAEYSLYSPAAPDLTTASDNGQSTGDNVTSLTSLTFTGTVPADSFVKLYDYGVYTGISQQLQGGATIYSLTISSATNSPHVFQVRCSSSSSSTNDSQFSTGLAVWVDSLAASTPSTAPVLDASSDLGQFQNDNLTTDTTPTFAGNIDVAAPVGGTTVTLWKYVFDSMPVGQFLVPFGTTAYSVTASPPIAPGAYSFFIRTQNVSSAPSLDYARSPELTVTIDDGAAAVATITQASGTQANPAYAPLGSATITFNKPVYNVAKADLALYRRDVGSVTSAVSATQFSAAQFSSVSPLPPLSPSNDYYNGRVLRFTSGALAGQSQTVLAYVGSTGTFTFSSGFSAAPSVGDVFVVDAPVNGTVATATSASQFSGAAPLATADDWYNTKTLRFTSGALSGQSRVISDYTGSTRTFTFGTAFSQAPSVGDKFLIDGPVSRLVTPSGANVTSSNGTTWFVSPAQDMTMTTGQYALSVLSGNGILNVAGGTAHPAATGPMEWWQSDKQYQNGGLTDGPNNLPGIYYDVTRDGFIVPADALEVINAVNGFGSGTMPRPGMNCNSPNFCYQDVNGDGSLTSSDSLTIISYLNAGFSQQPQGFAPGGGGGDIPPVDLQPGDVTANVILRTVDLNGNPIASIAKGQQFQLQAFLSLAAPAGVQPFAGYADVAYPASLVAAASSASDVGLVGSTAGRGLIDEAGRVMYPDAAGLMFSQTFTATKKGTATFTADAADLFGHEIYVTGLNEPLPWSQVTFGSTTLTIK